MWRCRSSLFIRLTGPTPVSAYIYLYVYMYNICTPTPVIAYIYIFIHLYLIYVTLCKTLSPVRIQPTSKIQHQTMNIAKPRGPRAPPPQGGGPSISSRPSSESEQRPSNIEHRPPPPSPFDIDPTIILASTVTEIASEILPIAICFAESSPSTFLSFGANISVFVLRLPLIDAW